MRLLLLSLIALLVGSDPSAQTIEPPFAADYDFIDLGPVPGVPSNHGGATCRAEEPLVLYLVGQAATTSAAVYRVPITRGPGGHISGFAGTAVKHADAPNADGGLQFGPGGVLFFTRYKNNELGQIKPGSTAMDKSIPLGPWGVYRSVGGLAFIPQGFPRAGDLKLISYNSGFNYTATLEPDGSGTYDVTSVTPGPISIVGGLEGFFYVPPGSPQFPDYEHVVVCRFGTSSVVSFRLDAQGDIDKTTEQVLMSDVNGCIGAGLDAYTGDLAVSIYGGAPRLLVMRGFAKQLRRVRSASAPLTPLR